MLDQQTKEPIGPQSTSHRGLESNQDQGSDNLSTIPQLELLKNTQPTLNKEPVPSSLLNIKREFINMTGKTTYVLEDGNRIAEGSNECLYGRDYDGRLVTEYSDSGRELSAKQVYDFNIKRNKFTYFWVSGYSAQELERQVAIDPTLSRRSTSHEWEV